MQDASSPPSPTSAGLNMEQSEVGDPVQTKPVAGDKNWQAKKDWRKRDHAAGGRGTGQQAQRFLLTGLAMAAVVTVAVIAFAPLSSWQTACFALSLDNYPLGLLAPVPYGQQDVQAIEQVVAGRCSPVGERNLIKLTGYETSSAIRGSLVEHMQGLPLRTKDVVLAYVRAQSFAAACKPEIDSDANSQASCWLAASDFSLAGGQPTGVVGCRTVIEALAAAKNKTTVVAMDLGDLRWDPRIGVVAGLVPSRLEQDVGRGAGQNLDADGVWLMTSHDAFEFSSAYAGEKRSLFGKAFELALAGSADAPPWGDGNGVIELDELARFVTAATSAWAQQISGGRSNQRPVVWKVGVGRVQLQEIPPRIAVLRVPARSLSDQVGWLGWLFPAKKANESSDEDESGPDDVGRKSNETKAAVRRPKDDAAAPDEASNGRGEQEVTTAAEKPTPAASPQPEPAEPKDGEQQAQPQESPAQPQSQKTEASDANIPGPAGPSPAGKPQSKVPPNTDAAQKKKLGSTQAAEKQSQQPADQKKSKTPAAAPTDVWELLDTVNRRVRGDVASPALIDQSPHVVRMVRHRLASAKVALLEGGQHGLQAQRLIDAFIPAMQRFDQQTATAERSFAQSPLAAALRNAANAGVRAKADDLWRAAPTEVQDMLAARNEIIALVQAVLDLNGRISGGIYPALIDERIINACVAQAHEATAALVRFGIAGGGEGRDVEQLASDTQLLMHKILSLQQFVATAVQTVSGPTFPQMSRSCHELVELLAATGGAAERQSSVRDNLDGPVNLPTELEPPSAAGLLVADHWRVPQQIPPPMIRQIQQLASTQIELFKVSGDFHEAEKLPAVLQPLVDAISAAQAAVRALDETVATQDQADTVESILRLSGALSDLFVEAKMIAGSAEFGGPANLIDSDQLAGVLRVLDPRDADVAGLATIVMPANLRLRNTAPLQLKLVEGGLGTGSKKLVIDYQGDAAGVRQGEASVEFDPALVRVSRGDGTPLTAQEAFPAAALAWRGSQAELLVRPLASAGLTVRGDGLPITVVLRAGGRASRGSITLPPAGGRDLLLAVKGPPLTVTGPQDEDGWTHASSLEVAASDGAATDATAVPTLSLRSWPSGQTQWQLGVENLAGEARKVTVEVHSVPVDAKAVGRTASWNRLVTELEDPSSSKKPVLVAEDVVVGIGPGVTSIKLGPPEEKAIQPDKPVDPAAAKQPQAATEAAAESAGKAEGPTLIGQDIAVVVREEKNKGSFRRHIYRLRLEPIHPRHFVEARGTYDQRRQEIRVSLAATGGERSALPPGGVVGTLRPMETPERSTRSRGAPPTVVTRKPGVGLQPGNTNDEAIAAWNGGDQGIATLALDVNGYPRSFIFAIECSPATSGVEQYPQHDWHRVRINEPSAQRTSVRAPAESFPMQFLVDAPIDAFRDEETGSDFLQVVLRPIAVGVTSRVAERVVWTSFGSRQVKYMMDPKPKGLEVTTQVSDWSVDVSGEGFANLDVAADVRLTVAGRPQATIDSRQIIFDGTPPVIDAPPAVNAVVGRPAIVPLRVSDDVSDGFFIAPDRVRPGVSGLKTVEWAIDVKGTGKPEKWEPAVWLGGVQYEVRIDTKKLPTGVRLPLLVQATDRVGLSDPPSRIWLDVAAQPASPNNALSGRVVLDGRGERGVSVILAGPGGERRVTSDAKGAFTFTNLEPGEYTIQAEGAVRNTSRASEPTKVTVVAAPAGPVSVTLRLK